MWKHHTPKRRVKKDVRRLPLEKDDRGAKPDFQWRASIMGDALPDFSDHKIWAEWYGIMKENLLKIIHKVMIGQNKKEEIDI